MKLKTRLFLLGLWGVAFGYLEAVIVVYLREIYYPGGFTFPVVAADPDIALIETGRELATLILLWVVSEFNFRRFSQKLAVFMILFGLWDIFYYIFLKILLGWPPSLISWDVLFLIPLPWAGPVWAPVLVSFGLIFAGSTILIRDARGSVITMGLRGWMLEVVSALIIIVSFIIPGQAVIKNTAPDAFPWVLFLFGFSLGLGTYVYRLRTTSSGGL